MSNEAFDPTIYAAASTTSKKWAKACVDILYFIEHYVPKNLFDLDKAAPQQIELLRKVMRKKQYFAIRAPRKGGKTILVAIVACWLVLSDQSRRVFILSGSQNQAEWLYQYCSAIVWPHGPKGAPLRKFYRQFLVREPIKSRIEFIEGGWIRYAPASKKAVNAPTADVLIMDEYVLIDSVIVEQAFPMIRGSEFPMRFLLSTATPNEENTDAFLDILDKTEPGEELALLGWERVVWGPEDCGFLQTKNAKADAEVAKHFLDPEMYRTQYEGKNPKRAGRIFPRTFIHDAFKAPDPENPGFLVDGTEFDPDNIVNRGEAKGGIDWGFDADTALLWGYMGLERRIVICKVIVAPHTSPSDWANIVEDESTSHDIYEWYADAAGAFQNQEIRDRGIKVTRRPFQHRRYGKEWMIGILYYWLENRKLIIADIPENEIVKQQLLKYRRNQNGKPIKGNDHCVDGLLCLVSGWDPRYYGERDEVELEKIDQDLGGLANSWDSFSSSKDAWMPETWADNGDLRKQPWE